MKRYTLHNAIFTISFIVIFTPLCFLLIYYLFNYVIPSAVASEPLSKYNVSPIMINRDFSDVKEHADIVTVLMYHHIIPENQLKKHHFTESGQLIDMVVTLEQFTEQMDYLKEQKYTVLTLKEFEEFMSNNKKVPENSVLITFDDGYKNVFEFAYPVLKKHGFHAVNFIITGLIVDRTVSYDSSLLQYASIHELKEASDIFDYGNHTHSFHEWTETGVSYLEAYDGERVKEDLAAANEWLGYNSAFAAPYGEYNPETLDILRDLEIKMAFTVESGYADPSQHILEIPRFGMYPFYTIEDFIYILERK